jgi:flagellar biosynthesis/type III secretory pathway M-ring protein FliF/YscJ
MELVSKGLAPLVDLFKSMTPAARVTAAVLLVVAAASVTYLFHGQRATPHVYLMDGEKLSAAQLREMQAALGKAGLEAAIDGARISVPRGTESRSMAALGEAGALPAKPGHHMEKAVQSGGFLRIPHGQQETAERVAKQQELQSLIDGMRGVEHSAVMIDATDDGGFPRPKKVVTAAVAVWPDHARPLDRDTIQTVRQLLASSVSGLAGDAVTVIDMNTNAHYKGNDAPSETGSDYASQKKRHESEWKQTITAVLSYIPGVLVSANVELDETAKAPARVTASVNVPRSYLEYVWHKEHPQSSGLKSRPDEPSLADVERRELEKVQRLVANLLPRSAGDAAQPAVAVSTFYAPGESSVAGPELRDQAWAWLVMNWQSVSLGGLALVGLLVLRSMLRSIGSDESTNATAALSLPPALSLLTDRLDDGADGPAPFAPHQHTGPSLSHELADAVQNDPDAAVSVLRTWIGNAS